MLRRNFLSLAGAAVAAAQSLPARRQQEIEKLVSQEMSRQTIPGVSLAVAVGSDMLWSAGFGMSDLENFVPAKAGTVYRLGSVSKPITAVAAMQLWEAGKFDLDAPIQRYVPSFPRKQWTITPRQLLAHLGGIRHYDSLEEINSTQHYRDLTAALKIFQNDPLVAEPGTKFHYTTYGYVLLGAAVEAAATQRFMDYLRTRVFNPAAMDTIRQDHVYAIVPNRARGYAISQRGQLQNCALADTSNKIPGGGMASTAEDLIRFAIAFRKGALVKQSTADLMMAPQRLRDGHTSDYGLGWQLRNFDGRRLVQHTGGQQGVSTVLAMLPKENVAVAIMVNLEKAELEPLARKILQVLTELPARQLTQR